MPNTSSRVFFENAVLAIQSIVVERNIHDVVRLSMQQFPLGLLPDTIYSSGRVMYAAGDVFAIFTDGLVETMNACQEEFGLHWMERILHGFASYSLAEIYEAAIDAVARRGKQSDDRTLMLVSVLEAMGDSHAD